MTITIKQGDLLKQNDVDAIVNTVNCVGVMGKGIALQFRNKWPENNRAYEAACKVKQVRPGKMFVFDSGGLVKPNFIITFRPKTTGAAKRESSLSRRALPIWWCKSNDLGLDQSLFPRLAAVTVGWSGMM